MVVAGETGNFLADISVVQALHVFLFTSFANGVVSYRRLP